MSAWKVLWKGSARVTWLDLLHKWSVTNGLQDKVSYQAALVDKVDLCIMGFSTFVADDKSIAWFEKDNVAVYINADGTHIKIGAA